MCVDLRMVSIQQFVDVFTFLFFLTSPLTSYGDQIFAMHRRKSSAGFSIDVCGIMLAARYVLAPLTNGLSLEAQFLGFRSDADLVVFSECSSGLATNMS